MRMKLEMIVIVAGGLDEFRECCLPRSRCLSCLRKERCKYIPGYRGTGGTKLHIQASYMSITISIYLKNQSSKDTIAAMLL